MHFFVSDHTQDLNPHCIKKIATWGISAEVEAIAMNIR
jgi:hypothetical protein